MNAKLLGMTMTFACALGLGAAPLYVDVNNPNASDEAGEGRGTEALPYKTIQAAVDAAAVDDTVWVKPGVYGEGGVSDANGDSRVSITKRIRLEATSDRDDTIIKGALGGSGWGSAAVRGIFVSEEAKDAVIKGFTVCNAGSKENVGVKGRGAGIYIADHAYVVDCAITNCYGYDTGCALYRGTMIRSLVKDIKYKDHTWKGGILDLANVWCSVVHTATEGGYDSIGTCTNVNCTYVETGIPRDHGSYYYNCIRELHGGDNGQSVATYIDSVKRADVLFAPGFGDYTPVLSDSVNLKIGVTSRLRSLFTVPDEFAATDFNGNAIDYTSETCVVGASTVAEAPACGRISLSKGVKVDGQASAVADYETYYYSHTYPRVLKVTCDNAALFSSGDKDATPLTVPLRDGRTFLVTFPEATWETYGTWYSTAPVLWVSQADGSDETGDGTEENPYATIQAACDALPANSYGIVKVKAGEYAGFSYTQANGYFARVFAVEGPEKTALVGTEDAACIRYSNGTRMAVQGFTIMNSPNGIAEGNGILLADCVVSNNVTTGSLLTGWAVRTRFVDNTAGGSIYAGSGGMSFCQFHHNTCSLLVWGGGNPSLYNCSFTANVTADGASQIGTDNVYMNNCLIDANGCGFGRNGDTGIAPNYVYNYTAVGSTSNPQVKDGDPGFVDRENGDIRLPRGSAAATEGVWCGTASHMANYHFWAQGDVDGNENVFTADGKTIMGCKQTGLYDAVYVSAANDGLAVAGGKLGVNEIPAGGMTLTFSRAAGGTRYAVGVVVTRPSGVETNLFAGTGAAECTFTADDNGTSVEAIYSNEFYVDAEDGNDANDGFTPETAKKTLVAVTGLAALTAGDVIHAAAGTYDSGRVRSSHDIYTYSRVILPAGVTLVADEGAAATTIKGADAEGPVPRYLVDHGEVSLGFNTGTNATRCAYLCAGARLEGFTLRGGRTFHRWDGKMDGDYCGAGVLAENVAARIVNCVFTDCYGVSGSAGRRGTYIRCKATNGQKLMSGATVVSCRLKGSTGALIDGCKIYNSVLYPADNSQVFNDVASYLYNTLLFGVIRATCTYEKCIWGTTTASPYNPWTGPQPSDPPAGVTHMAYADIKAKLDANDCPTADNDFMVDCGDNALMYALDDDTNYDLAGAPRVMNRTVDIGAYEYDVRALMREILNDRIAHIDYVTPNAVIEDGKVTLDGDGARLAMTPSDAFDVPLAMTFGVTDGTLKAYVDGTLVATLTASGAIDFGLMAKGAQIVFAFEGAGRATFESILASSWYVDASKDDDEGDGMTPETAKKTLAGLFTDCAVVGGDVVYAAPGTYDEGTMADSDGATTLSRVVVPAGITLKSTEGKAVTTILGAGTTSADAVRCVSLGKGAKLIGFTLKDGRALSGDFGAAVCCGSGADGTVIDCNMTGCEARDTACCGRYVTFIRCRADGCRQLVSGNLFMDCTLVSCVVNRSHYGGTCDSCSVYNSVILPNYGYFSLNEKSVNKAYNSLLYGPISKAAGSEYVNCVCATNLTEFYLWGTTLKPGDAMAEKVKFVHLDNIGYVTSRPTTEKALTNLVDKGDTAAAYPFDEFTRIDLEGAPRAMNYDIDIGAYEYDTRPEIRSVLGSRVASVDWMSANVVTNGGLVMMDGDGARIELTAETRGKTIKLETPVTIDGTGTLTAYVDGTAAATLTESGKLKLATVPTGAKVVLAFEGTGSASFAKLRFVRGILVIVR